MKTAFFAAALALGAAGPHAHGSQDLSGAFDVEVEISQRSSEDFLARFRIRDAVSHHVIAEPALPFTASAAGGVTVTAQAADTCAMLKTAGYCMTFSVGGGPKGARTEYEAFISRAGDLQLTKRL
jgi:hypothetical protein